MMRKAIALTAVILSLFSLSAKPEIWTGIGLRGGRNFLSDWASDKIASGYKYNDADFINTLGPSLEIAFYPFSGFRLGFAGSASSDFILALYRKDGSSDFERRTNGDLVWSLNGGLSYVQLFGSSWGLFADGFITMKGYIAAMTNNKNSRDPAEFVTFEEYGFTADCGLSVKSQSSYFRFGFSYSMPYDHDNGWSLDVFALGGIIL